MSDARERAREVVDESEGASNENTPTTPSAVDVDAELKSVQKKLASRKDPDSIRDAEYLKRALRGLALVDDPAEDRARALALTALVVVRAAPPLTTSEQVQRVLLGSAGMLAASLPECVAGAMLIASKMPPILARATSTRRDGDLVINLRTLKPDTSDEGNFEIVLARLGVTFRHDEFMGRDFVERDGAFEIVTDKNINSLMFEIEREYGFHPLAERFPRYCADAARRNSYHPAREYFDARQHDPNCDEDLTTTWLIKFGGAEDTPYVRAVSRLLLVACVRRVREPGAKYDELVIFEGEQGDDKSQALRALCPVSSWFTDALEICSDDKITREMTEGVLIAELSELDGMSKHEVNKFKRWIAKRFDVARMSYDKHSGRCQRQFVFTASTNDEEYLRDMTGNRRFWPIRIPRRFDVAGLEAARDQIWSQAAKLEAAGESIRLAPSLYAAAGAEQEKRRVKSDTEHRLSDALGEITDGRIVEDDVRKLLEKDNGTAEQKKAKREAALKKLGWKDAGPILFVHLLGKKQRGWKKGDGKATYRLHLDGFVPVAAMEP